MTAVPPLPGGGPAQKTAHDVIAIAAFELIGVGLLTILADTGPTIGNIVLLFMVAILIFWFIARGAGFLAHFTSGISKLTKG